MLKLKKYLVINVKNITFVVGNTVKLKDGPRQTYNLLKINKINKIIINPSFYVYVNKNILNNMLMKC